MTVQVSELSTSLGKQDPQKRNDSAYRSTVTYLELPDRGSSPTRRWRTGCW
jgi:hypothetical protein